MVFESTFTLIVLELMILFLVLWIVNIQWDDGEKQLEKLTQQLHGINLSLHGIGNKMSGMRSTKESPQTSLTVDAVKRVLVPEVSDPEDPSTMYFFIIAIVIACKQTVCRILRSGLSSS